jgi:hypothetical protein
MWWLFGGDVKIDGREDCARRNESMDEDSDRRRREEMTGQYWKEHV